MNFFQSLRWRIQMWHGLLLVCVIGGFCLLTYRLQSTDALRRADNDLKLRLSFLSNTLGRFAPPDGPGPNGPGPGGPPPSPFNANEVRELFSSSDATPYYFRIWKRTGEVLDSSAYSPGEIPLPERGFGREERTQEGFREVFHFTPPGECLLVGRSLAPVREEMRAFALWLTGIGCGVVAIGLIGGWWLSSRALRPIANIGTTALKVAGGDLAARVPISESSSELGVLAVTLNDSFAKLESAFAQQARFTSDAAHELRTPVALILAQAQLALSRPRDTEEYRETIETVQRAARRMHQLIESLLELSRLDAGAEQLQLEACDLSRIAGEQLELLRPLAEERGVVLRGNFSPAPCEAEPESIARIITNLVGNALKFSSTGTEVVVATSRRDGRAILSVTDQGEGIAQEHLPHVFERFYRADASRNRATGGAGLGLSICLGIAEAHGGELRVTSEPGQGSSFTLSLPSDPSNA